MTPAAPGHAPHSVGPDVLLFIGSITVWTLDTGGRVPSSNTLQCRQAASNGQ